MAGFSAPAPGRPISRIRHDLLSTDSSSALPKYRNNGDGGFQPVLHLPFRAGFGANRGTSHRSFPAHLDRSLAFFRTADGWTRTLPDNLIRGDHSYLRAIPCAGVAASSSWDLHLPLEPPCGLRRCNRGDRFSVFEFFDKKFFLATPFLIGTTTRPITFDLPQILLFIWRGTLNLVGINSGPAYLSLEDFPESPLWMRVLSVATAVLSIVLVLGAVASIMTSERSQKTRSIVFRLALYASAVAGLLLSASITFRQMYSWLYPAYLGFLAFLGFRGPNKRDASPRISARTHVPRPALDST